MQLFLPVFPKAITPISACVDVFEHDRIVQYFAGAAPVYSHKVNDQPYFRFVVSNLVAQHLCTQTEVARCFGVSIDSVSKWHKLFVKEGPNAFFGPDARRGKAHKITGETRERIQQKLDKGQSNNSIAKEEGVTESAIRYAISVGHLKKKPG
jgi:predicted transcriptional regulator